MHQVCSGADRGAARATTVEALIDLHAHILPALDDGPADMAAAVAMAQVAVAAGTRIMATTSHVHVSYGLGAGDLQAARAALAERLAAEGVALELVGGGEVSTRRLPGLTDDDLRRLSLGGGPWVLLECPFGPADIAPHVADLHRRGFGVVLAHPERSATFQRDPAQLGALVERGALGQVTAGSLRGDFGPLAERTARRMLRAGWVHVLATDAHDTLARPPDLTVAAHELDDDQFVWMTELAPAALLAGQRPKGRPPLARRRRLRRATARSNR
jgi:protein-tyrosine phosphatase